LAVKSRELDRARQLGDADESNEAGRHIARAKHHGGERFDRLRGFHDAGGAVCHGK
jgi:hypothetical protein